jgi:adenylate cyclase
MAEERVQRRLAAILVADVVGYSRLIEQDEEGTRIRLRSLHAEVIAPRIAADGGRIVKTSGDGVLVEFGSAVDAVRNALAIQEAMTNRDSNLPEDRRIRFRVGINLGDVIVEGNDIHGDGVNVAARLEGLCAPGAVFVSGTIYDQVDGKLAALFDDLGEQTVKNISKPVRVYEVSPAAGKAKTAASAAAELDRLFDRPAVAVLPFENVSGDPEQEYFADGLAEDLITALSLWRWFPVIARNSTFAYKGTSPDIRIVARDLGARYIVEGSVRKSGDRLRVTAQLIEAETGHHIWAERYDKTSGDLFDLQDEITESIAAIVAPELEKAEHHRLEVEHNDNLDAWDLLKRGLSHYYRFTKEENLLARNLFLKAVELDPTYARAIAAVAFTYSTDLIYGFSNSPSETMKAQNECARRAVEHDASEPVAYQALGVGYAVAQEYERSIRALRTSLELNPCEAGVLNSIGQALSLAGQPEEAIPYLEKGLRLSPRDPRNSHYFGFMARALFALRRYEEAVDWLRRSLELTSSNAESLLLLAASLGHLGRIDEARSILAKCEACRPGYTHRSGWIHHHSVEELNEHLAEGLRKAGLSEGEIEENAPPTLPDKPSIAVLPFENMSGDPEQEYFSDGITEDIITELSKISGLFVIARHSAFTYKGKSVTLKQVGRELGVRYVLEGSVRKAGNRLRITAQLIDATSDHHVWAERYDRDLEDVFAVQEEVALRVVDALAVALKPGEGVRLSQSPTDDLQVYELYLRLRGTPWPPNRENILTAANAYRRLSEKYSSFAGGFAGQALTGALSVLFGHSARPDADAQNALEMAQRAISLNDEFALSHSALGFANLAMGRFDEAVAAARRAVELQPGDAESHANLSFCLSCGGQGEEAVEAARTALRLDPQFADGPYLNHLARSCFVAERYEEAVDAYERNRARGGPMGVPMLAVWAASYSAIGRLEEAREIVQDILRLSPNISLAEWKRIGSFKMLDGMDRMVGYLRQAGLPE